MTATRGLHSFTSKLKLSRACHEKTPFTPFWVRLICGSEIMRNQPTDHVQTCLYLSPVIYPTTR
jgi:hypothetical protein